MSLLTRDLILAADDLAEEDVECPEWGGTVRIRTLTGTDRDEFEFSLRESRKSGNTMNVKNIRARLVARSVVDDQGHRVFSDADASKLGLKSAAALDRCFDVAARLSGLGEKDVEEMAQDFDPAQSEPSSTD